MIDPTVEFVSIEIEGKTYQMVFDLGSLASAESAINKAGGEIDVLHGVDFKAQKMDAILLLFACSLRRAHPELKHEDLIALAGRQSLKMLNVIYEAVASALVKSMGIEDDPIEKKAETAETTEQS